MAELFQCPGCEKAYPTMRGLSGHLQHNEDHRAYHRRLAENNHDSSAIHESDSEEADLVDKEVSLDQDEPDDFFDIDQSNDYTEDNFPLTDDVLETGVSNPSNANNNHANNNETNPAEPPTDVGVIQIVDVNMFARRKLMAAEWIDNTPPGYKNTLLEMIVQDRRDVSPIPKSLIAEIKLMETIGDHKATCPTGLFDKLGRYMKKYLDLDNMGDLAQLRTKQTVMNDLKQITNMTTMEPKTHRVRLHQLKTDLDVPVFDLTAVLYDLLTAPSLDKDENYIFKTNNPLDDPETESFDNFDTGSRYQSCFDQYKHLADDLPLPLILFIDSANVTWNDRISVEPVMLQLGIHNRETRYSERSFRNLGVIPKLISKSYKGGDSGLKKMKDYHQVLSTILSGIQKANSEGLRWVLRWKGKLFKVTLRPYVLAILGDYPGHNLICGKFGGNNKQSKCRTCRCPNDELSLARTYPLILKEDYGPDASADDLAEISMHRLDNCFNQIPFGSCKYGICGLCHGETVHIIQGGVEERLLEGLQTAKIVSTDARKYQAAQFEAESKNWFAKNAKRIRIEVEEPVDHDTATRTTLCLGGKTARQFNALGTFVGTILKYQSNRDLPPMPHAKGITNTSKTTSSEKQGLLLLYLIIFCTTHGQKVISKRFGEMKMAYIIEVIELVLCLEELCKDTRGIPIDVVQQWENFWLSFKPVLCYVTDRTGGDGNNLIKLHMVDHLPEVTRMYGSPANISGGPGENNQKNQKAAGRRTQMNENVFPHQQSRKLFDMMVLQNAIDMIDDQTQTDKEPKVRSDAEALSAPKYLICLQGNRFVLRSRTGDHPLTENLHAKQILRFARKQWLKNGRPRPVEPTLVFTELRKTEDGLTTLYRSDCIWQPKLQKGKLLRHRNDWAMFRWLLGKEEDIPGKLLGFFEKTDSNLWLFDSKCEMEPGTVFVLLHSLISQPNNYFDCEEKQIAKDMAHPSSRLIFKGSLEMDKDTPTIPKNHFLPAQNIVGTATVIPDLHPVFDEGDNEIVSLVQPGDPGHEHLFFRDRRQWSEVLQAVIRNNYSQTQTIFPVIT